MKKLFLIPALLICMTGASSNKIEPEPIKVTLQHPALNTQVDSINVKVMELNRLLHEQ